MLRPGRQRPRERQRVISSTSSLFLHALGGTCHSRRCRGPCSDYDNCPRRNIIRAANRALGYTSSPSLPPSLLHLLPLPLASSTFLSQIADLAITPQKKKNLHPSKLEASSPAERKNTLLRTTYGGEEGENLRGIGSPFKNRPSGGEARGESQCGKKKKTRDNNDSLLVSPTRAVPSAKSHHQRGGRRLQRQRQHLQRGAGRPEHAVASASGAASQN